MRAGWETGLPQGVVPRPRQILEVCELLDGADAHMVAEEEGRQDSWIFILKPGKVEAFKLGRAIVGSWFRKLLHQGTD